MALTEAEEALAAAEIALTEVKEFMVADSVAGTVMSPSDLLFLEFKTLYSRSFQSYTMY